MASLFASCGSTDDSNSWDGGSSGQSFPAGTAGRLKYRSARQSDPYDFNAWLGEIDSSPDRPAQATLRADLNKLMAKEQDPAHRAEFLALSSFLENSDTNLNAALQNAVEDAPQSPLVLGARARYLENRGDTEKADPLWILAAANRSTPAFVLEGVSRSQIRSRDLREAAKSLRRFLSLRPESTWAQYNLATILLDPIQDADAAFRILEKLAPKLPDDLDVALNYASSALLSGREQRALEIMNQTAVAFPKEPLAQFNLAVFHADHGRNPALAISHFERYLALGGEQTLRVKRWIRELNQKLES